MLITGATTLVAQQKEQQVKDAAVSDGSLYEDIVNVPFDDKGLDITVHIAFDETDNLLTLSLTGTRQMFVFQDDTYRKKAFTGWFSRRSFHPERLSYPTLVEPKTKYKLTSPVVKSFNKPRKKHLFNKWITNVSKALTPLASPLTSVTPDSIVQTFSIDPKATKVSFTLRNILVLDTKEPMAQAAEKRNSGKTIHYRFVLDHDLATTYNVQLKRNPCFGARRAIDSLRTRVAEVRNSYRRLQKSCPTGKATSDTEVNIFNQHRQYLLARYAPIADSTKCSDLQTAYDAYNSYVDSIAGAPCVYIPVDNSGSTLAASMGISPETMIAAAKRLDDIVASIMVSRDPVEIRDLRNLGRDIIRSVNANLSTKNFHDDEQRRALAVLRKAEEYFLSITMKL